MPKKEDTILKRVRKFALRDRQLFEMFELKVNFSHYPKASFISGTSIMVPEEHAKEVYTTNVVDEKYWYWDEIGAANYIKMTEEEGYDVFKRTRDLLGDALSEIMKIVFDFLKKKHCKHYGKPPIQLVVLGVGSAQKENMILTRIIEEYRTQNLKAHKFRPIIYTPVDISFPLLTNSLRMVFADKMLRNCLFDQSLILRPVLTDFLKGLPGCLEKKVGKLIIAQGIVWNAPVPKILDALRDLMTTDSLLLMDVEFVGGRDDEKIKRNYYGKAAQDFFYHPLELLNKASQTKENVRFVVNGEHIPYNEAFNGYTLDNGKIIPDIVQLDTFNEFLTRYNICEEARSKIRLSPDPKSKTVIILYKPNILNESLDTIVLGYSTRFDREEFENLLIQKGFGICGRWLDDSAVFGQYLLSLNSENRYFKSASISRIHAPLTTSKPDKWVGSVKETAQWGIIGKSDNSFVKFDLNRAHTVFVCGGPGSGKGYTIGVLCEMLVGKSIPKISKVSDKERATIIVLHKSTRHEDRSDFWSIARKNDDPEECQKLEKEYGVKPCSLVSENNIQIFVNPAIKSEKLGEFREEYKTDNVFPFIVDPSTITTDDWKNVLKVGPLGIFAPKTVTDVYYKIKKVRDETGIVSIDAIIREVKEDMLLKKDQREAAIRTLEILKPYLADGNQHFIPKLKLGGVNIFDFREKGELTLPQSDMLLIVALILSVIQTSKELRNKPVVLIMNEAHEYFKKEMPKEFIEVIESLLRWYRHGLNWLILDTQLANDVHPSVVNLADIKIVHSSKSIENKDLKNALGKIADKPILPKEKGVAYIVADESSEKEPILTNIRSRLTKHGGSSKTFIKSRKGQKA